MFNFLINILTTIIIFLPNGVLACRIVDEETNSPKKTPRPFHKVYKEDIESSKERFLISGREKQESKGVMTLCFIEPEKKGVLTFAHPALVFELILPGESEISVHMIHYTGDEDSCGCGSGKNKKPKIEIRENTLAKAYRGFKAIKETDTTGEYQPARYIRYASWELSIADPDTTDPKGPKGLKAAYDEAATDEQNHTKDTDLYDSYTCVDYVRKIMKRAGVKVHFSSWWANTPDHLKESIGKTKGTAGCFGGYITQKAACSKEGYSLEGPFYSPIPDPIIAINAMN